MTITGKVWTGTAINTAVEFVLPDGTITDPSEITLSYSLGAGIDYVVWIYGEVGSIVKTGTGLYNATIDTTDAPTNPTVTLVWRGTGACAAVTVVELNLSTPPA